MDGIRAPLGARSPGGRGDPVPERPVWRLALWWVASVLAALLHNGLWATPNLAFVSTIAQNPGENPFTAGLRGDYLLTDVSLTSLAAVTGQTAPHEVARLHLVLLVAAWAGVVLLTRWRVGYSAARTLTVLLAAAPVVTVSMQWLGQPDPLTAMCGIGMVLVRRRRWVVALAVLAGLTHPEQALFMAVVAGTVRALLPGVDEDLPAERRWRTMLPEVLAAVGGVLGGRLITQLWFLLNDIVVQTPRTAYLDLGLRAFLEHHRQVPAGLLWSLWGPLWLVIAAVGAVSHLQRRERLSRPEGWTRAWLTMAVVALAALAPVVVTLDETRVYAVVTAPLLPAAALWLATGVPRRLLVRGAAALLVLTALVPGAIVTGVPSWRSQLDTPAMLAFLADGSIPAPSRWRGGPTDVREDDLTAWLLSPFDVVIPDLLD